MNTKDYKQKKRECLFDFCREHGYKITPNVEGIFGYAFDRAYALGKQEKNSEETVIKGWVAKDADTQGLYLYSSMPTREINMWNGHGSLLMPLDANSFPDLTWDDEPIEVEIIIKRKKNG